MRLYVAKVNGKPYTFTHLDMMLAFIGVLRITLPSAVLTAKRVRLPSL